MAAQLHSKRDRALKRTTCSTGLQPRRHEEEEQRRAEEAEEMRM